MSWYSATIETSFWKLQSLGLNGYVETSRSQILLARASNGRPPATAIAGAFLGLKEFPMELWQIDVLGDVTLTSGITVSVVTGVTTEVALPIGRPYLYDARNSTISSSDLGAGWA
jgi:hypothetical protein